MNMMMQWVFVIFREKDGQSQCRLGTLEFGAVSSVHLRWAGRRVRNLLIENHYRAGQVPLQAPGTPQQQPQSLLGLQRSPGV